jgi:hypothetical protein
MQTIVKACMCKRIATTPCDCETCLLAAQLIRGDIVSYEGWANRSTWNVALWVDNDEGLYNWKEEIAKRGGKYADLVEAFADAGVTHTGDGIAFDPLCSEALDVGDLDDWMRESYEDQEEDV